MSTPENTPKITAEIVVDNDGDHVATIMEGETYLKTIVRRTRFGLDAAVGEWVAAYRNREPVAPETVEL